MIETNRPIITFKHQPIISVVIVAYHAECLIARALSSIKTQTFSEDDLELICVIDDADFDETPKIVQGLFPTAYIIQRRKKTSPAIARNIALSLASGKYLAFLDADDEWRPHHLENAVHTLNFNPDVAVYYAKCMDHLDDRAYNAHGFAPECLYDLCPAPHSTVVCRNPPKARFDECLRGADDWKWFIDNYEAGRRFYFNPEIESYYHIHGGNLTGCSGRWHRQEMAVFWYARHYRHALSLLPLAIREWLWERVRKISEVV